MIDNKLSLFENNLLVDGCSEKYCSNGTLEFLFKKIRAIEKLGYEKTSKKISNEKWKVMERKEEREKKRENWL